VLLTTTESHDDNSDEEKSLNLAKRRKKSSVKDPSNRAPDIITDIVDALMKKGLITDCLVFFNYFDVDVDVDNIFFFILFKNTDNFTYR